MTLAPLLASTWPVTTVGAVVTVLSLVLAVVTGVLAALDRRITRWVLALVAVLEVALLVLTLQRAVAWIRGNSPEQPVVLLAYLAVVLVAGPARCGGARPSRVAGAPAWSAWRACSSPCSSSACSRSGTSPPR